MRLTIVNSDLNRVQAILKNRMSLDWFSTDSLCQQPPGEYWSSSRIRVVWSFVESPFGIFVFGIFVNLKICQQFALCWTLGLFNFLYFIFHVVSHCSYFVSFFKLFFVVIICYAFLKAEQFLNHRTIQNSTKLWI